MIREIEGFDSKYWITDHGEILSFWKRPIRFIYPRVNTKGYVQVALQKPGGDRRQYLLHRLIAKAFIPNPDNLPQINHKNGIKTDNIVANLEWVTAQRNITHSIETGLKGPGKYHAQKLMAEDVMELRLLASSGMTSKQLAVRFNINPHHALGIIHRRYWKTV